MHTRHQAQNWSPIESLRRLGVEPEIRDGRLRLRPPEKLTDDVVRLANEHADSILAALEAEAIIPPDVLELVAWLETAELPTEPFNYCGQAIIKPAAHYAWLRILAIEEDLPAALLRFRVAVESGQLQPYSPPPELTAEDLDRMLAHDLSRYCEPEDAVAI